MDSATPTTAAHPATERIRAYFSAYHHGDSRDYAAQWTYPAGLYADGRWLTVPDAATMARNNDEYARVQREAGAVGGEILQLEATAIGPDAALVRGRFARLRGDGSRLDEVAASYLVVRLAGLEGAEAWKVAVCLTGR
jgi:hypothetical protein